MQLDKFSSHIVNNLVDSIRNLGLTEDSSNKENKKVHKEFNDIVGLFDLAVSDAIFDAISNGRNCAEFFITDYVYDVICSRPNVVHLVDEISIMAYDRLAALVDNCGLKFKVISINQDDPIIVDISGWDA